MSVLHFRTLDQQRRIVLIGRRSGKDVALDVLPPVSHASFRAKFATADEAHEAAAKLSQETGWRVFDATIRFPRGRRAGQ